jgi:ribonuclease R
MEQKCKHCSERERAAMDAERAANKYKQVEYMRDFLGDEFDGVISGVSAFGFWVETVEHKCEGMVSITTLADYDDFRLVDTDYALVGMRSGRKFRMGDKVRIKVVAASLEKRQLDYEWVLTTNETDIDTADSVGASADEDTSTKKSKSKRKKKKNTEEE